MTFSFPPQTLGGINHNTGIPPPPSSMKRSNSASGNAPYSNNHVRSVSGSRNSLALGRPSQPLFGRTSSGTNLADMGMSSVKRASFANQPGSALKGYASGNLPSRQSESERRSSIYRARPSTAGPMSHGQSFFQQGPQAAGGLRDPRNPKDRSHLARIGQELLDYLAQHNFEMEMKHTLSPNSMKSPTQKDFNYMFQWLYHRIDPSYHGGDDRFTPCEFPDDWAIIAVDPGMIRASDLRGNLNVLDLGTKQPIEEWVQHMLAQDPHSPIAIDESNRLLEVKGRIPPRLYRRSFHVPSAARCMILASPAIELVHAGQTLGFDVVDVWVAKGIHHRLCDATVECGWPAGWGFDGGAAVVGRQFAVLSRLL